MTVLISTALLKRTVTTLLDRRSHGKARGFREQKAGGVSEGKAFVPSWVSGRTDFPPGLSFLEGGGT